MAKNCFSLVIFDLDGTLVNAFDDIARAANHVRSRNGLSDLSVDEVKLHVGHGARQLVEGLLDSTDTEFIDENLRELVSFYESMKDSQAHVYEGVVETLTTLRESAIRTAVASNKPHPLTVKVVEQLGLTRYFDSVRGEGNSIRRKPAPDVLQKIMTEAGVPPERTLMVGDSVVDIETAKAAGVRVAAVSYGQTREDVLAGKLPDYMIHRMPELLTVV